MIGFINLHKTTGMTSHDCVYRVRKVLKLKRVGHGGTLDPEASGVLSIAVGGATRLLPYLPNTKVYRALIRLGVVTTTDDLEGDIISQQSSKELTLEKIQPYLEKFIGNITQIPPAYSAISVDGVRLYEKARKGEIVQVPARQVDIYSIEVLNWLPGEYPELQVKITCGSGTYIRSIARDLGKALEVGGTLAGLIRLESGGFSLNESLTLEELTRQVTEGVFSLIPPDIALKHLGKVTLSETEQVRFCQGQKVIRRQDGEAARRVADGRMAKPPEGWQEAENLNNSILVYSEKDFLGIGESEDLFLVPKIVLNP